MATSTDRPSYYGIWLEPYATYHARYLALRCQDQHDTAFFAACCSPLWAGETLNIRPAACSPAQATTASSSAASSPLASSSLSIGQSAFWSTATSITATASPESSSSVAPSLASFSSSSASAAPSSAATAASSTNLSVLLPAILVPVLVVLGLLALVVVCCRRRRERRRRSWNGWDDAGSGVTGQTQNRSRFAGVPVLSYIRRSLHTTPPTPASRPPSYTYRRASALVSDAARAASSGAAPGPRPVYGALGRGLARERDEQVRRESRGLLAAAPAAEGSEDDDDDDAATGYGTRRTASSSSYRSSGGGGGNAYDPDRRFMRGGAHDADGASSSANTTFSSAATFGLTGDNDDDDDDESDAADRPTPTPAIVQFARLSQRGARRLDPRVVRPSEFGLGASPSAGAGAHDEGGLQPPSRLRFADGSARRGSTASSRTTSAYYSAPSTPVVAEDVPRPPSSSLPFATARTAASEASGGGSVDPGLVSQTPLPVRPDETVHLVPARAGGSPGVRLTEAFDERSSESDSPATSMYAPSIGPARQVAFGGVGGGRTDESGILLGARASNTAASGPHQRVRIVEQAESERRCSNRVSVQHLARPDAGPTIDEYDLGESASAPELGEYDLGERR